MTPRTALTAGLSIAIYQPSSSSPVVVWHICNVVNKQEATSVLSKVNRRGQTQETTSDARGIVKFVKKTSKMAPQSTVQRKMQVVRGDRNVYSTLQSINNTKKTVGL